MKKLCLLAVCCLFLFTGCGKKKEEEWYLNFSASKFKWEEKADLIFAVGTITNKTDKTCHELEAKLTYKREGFERHTTCLDFPDLEPGQAFELKCMYIDDSPDTIMKYSITIDSIKCLDE